MPDIVIKNVRSRTLEKLVEQAKRNNRSLETEIREILSEAAAETNSQMALENLRKFRASISNKNQIESAILLREDRAR